MEQFTVPGFSAGYWSGVLHPHGRDPPGSTFSRSETSNAGLAYRWPKPSGCAAQPTSRGEKSCAWCVDARRASVMRLRSSRGRHLEESPAYLLDGLEVEVWQPGMSTGQKDATEDDSAGGSLGVYNCGGEKPPALHNCPGDDEVIHLDSRGAIRRENAVELAGAVAIHSVSSRLRTGYDSSCSSCRSSRGLVQGKGSSQIAVSIVRPCRDCYCYVSPIVADDRIVSLKAYKGVAFWVLGICGRHAEKASENQHCWDKQAFHAK